MKALVYHAGLVLGLFIIWSCTMQGHRLDGEGKEIRSIDALSSIHVPLSWVQLDIHQRAVIQAADPDLLQFVVVLSENRFGYWQYTDLDLEGFFRVKSWYLIDTLSDVSLGSKQECTLHGDRAVMLEIAGKRNDEHITYLYTAVEGYHHYHEIILWTPSAGYEQARPLFLRIVRSFEER